MTDRIASLKPFNEYLNKVLPGVLLEKSGDGFVFLKGDSCMAVTATSFRNISFDRWMEEARWFNNHC